MRHKVFWWVASIVLAMMIGAPLLGFNANPAPQPQRVADLVARIEALEEENAEQQEMLDALSARLDALEESGMDAGAMLLDTDIAIPRTWVRDDSSDGIVRYWHDPDWELVDDEPGTINLLIDEETFIFFSWDWSADLLEELHEDEEFFRYFEEDLLRSDETLRIEVTASDAFTFMGEDAHYWEIRMEDDGLNSRLLTVFYPCSERMSCSITLVRFDGEPEDDKAVRAFSRVDWNFINTFAHGVEFLSEGEATVTANANLRACPALDCEIVGRLVRGEIVDVVAISEDGSWLQLKSGEWVSAGLVDGAPDDLPVVRERENI